MHEVVQIAALRRLAKAAADAAKALAATTATAKTKRSGQGEEFLTTNQLCELLHVSRFALVEQIRKGNLRPVRLPGFRRLLFRRSDIDAALH